MTPQPVNHHLHSFSFHTTSTTTCPLKDEEIKTLEVLNGIDGIERNHRHLVLLNMLPQQFFPC